MSPKAVEAELRRHIEGADSAFRKLLATGREMRAAWPWRPHDFAALLIGERAIQVAIEHELFRCGSRPRLFGGMAEPPDSGWNLPGGRAPSLQVTGLPGLVKPIDAVFADATAYAGKIMRGISIEPVAVAADVVPVAADPAEHTNGHGHDVAAMNGDASAGAGAAPVVVPRGPRTEIEERLDVLLREQNRLAQLAATDPRAEARYIEIVAEIAALQ